MRWWKRSKGSVIWDAELVECRWLWPFSHTGKVPLCRKHVCASLDYWLQAPKRPQFMMSLCL